MKALVLALGLCLLTLNSMAASKDIFPSTQDAADLRGMWSIESLVCTDGKPPRDRFQLERDQLFVTFDESGMRTVSVIDQDTYNKTETYMLSHNLITVIQSTGKWQAMGYSISKKDQLVLVTAGFGKGGTCSEGQALLSIFKRI